MVEGDAVARILIVDDDRDTCTFIEGLLAGGHREIVSESDPDAAIARIRREPFDVLVSDVQEGASDRPGGAHQRVRHA
jgi:CheY-like chemotaxis protein